MEILNKKKLVAKIKIKLFLALTACLTMSPARASFPVIDMSNLWQTIVSASENVQQTLKQVDQYRTVARKPNGTP